MTYMDEVRALLQRARAHLRDAIWSHGQGRHRIAVSVAYYAVFSAAKAVLAYHRDGAKTHKGVAKQFLQIAVLNSDFPSAVGDSMGAMLRQRLAADYDLSKPVDDWTEEEASLAIGGATAFVDEVEAWLIRKLPPGERLDTNG